MKISDFKDLKKLFTICRSEGIKTFECDGMKFELSEYVPVKRNNTPNKRTEIDSSSFAPNLDETIAIPQMQIETDEPSDEELLFYSSDTQS